MCLPSSLPPALLPGGSPVPAWALLNTLVNVLSGVVFTLTAALIWWRLRTWFGWLTGMVLLVGG